MQTIYLDISNKGVIPTIQAKQGDVGRKFLAVITDSGTTLSALENPVFSVWYDGDSGSGNYSAIDGKPAVVFDGKNATVELATQMLASAGDGEITLVMNDANGHQIGVWNIGYSVESVMGLDSEEVENYYTALSETATNAISAASRAEQAAEYAEESAYYKQNKLAWATDSDIDEMFAGTYEGVENEDPEGDGYIPGESGGIDISAMETITELPTGAQYLVVVDGVMKLYTPPKLIHFTLDSYGTACRYQAEEGMTWREWVDSTYNLDGYMIGDIAELGFNYVYQDMYYSELLPDRVIQDGDYHYGSAI